MKALLILMKPLTSDSKSTKRHTIMTIVEHISDSHLLQLEWWSHKLKRVRPFRLVKTVLPHEERKEKNSII